MLERRFLGELPPKPHTVFERKGKTMREHVFTRDGFAGGFSILYQEMAPTALKAMRLLPQDYSHFVGVKIPHEELPLARRHLKAGEVAANDDFLKARTALFVNESCRISTLKGKIARSDYAFCNGDADELYFVYAGSGELHSLFGTQRFRQHDYILIPRGISYRLVPDGELECLVVEGDQELGIPQEFRNPHGQLKLEAPYTHRDFFSPSGFLSTKQAEFFRRTVTLRNRMLTEHVYELAPVSTIGWDGSVYPMTFNIHDYLPKTGKIHLPPNLHLTFKATKFAVCSFVPRMVDYGEGAIPCPYPHSNVVCDEVMYYVSGEFTSRAGVGSRSFSFHPAGVPHGPQPGRYMGSVGVKAVEELVVMIDTWAPLHLTAAALGVEDASYQTSWIKK